MMTDPKQILEICEKATPGPWKIVEGKSFGVQSENSNIASCFRKENEQFIATARTALPELAQRVLDLEAEVERLREILHKAVPTEDVGNDWWCPTCNRVVAGTEVTNTEHHVDCGTYLTDVNNNEWLQKAKQALGAERSGE
jgi:hypothetical protein